MGTDGAIRKLLQAISRRGIHARRAGLLACTVACAIAVAPASAWAANASLTVSPITGSTGGYLVTVTNTGKGELTGFEFAPGPPENPSPPKQVVPNSTCSYSQSFIHCNAPLQPGASFQMCYQGAEVSLFEGILIAKLKPEGEIFGNGAGGNYTRPPVSACPLPGFTSSTSGSAAGKCKVPKVVGKTQASAEKAIRKAGCKVGNVKKQRSSHVKKGDVVSQGVGAGKSVASGTKVGLVVSKGK